MPPPRAVLFDAYGTLFDVHSVTALAEQLHPGHGASLSARWRDKQIEYSRLVSMSGRYRPFGELTRAALRYAAAAEPIALGADAEARLLAQYRRLAPHPGAADVLAALQQRGIATGILSNGDPEMLGAVVRHAGFDARLAHVLSVHDVRRYKTDPAAYALGLRALGLDAGEILFVSSNAWDAVGATWFGYRTLWVNRTSAPPEQLDTAPHHTGSSLGDVLPLFDPAPP